MLYKSLQQTIAEYQKRKKETQSLGDRKLFKWKIAAMSFSILLIVLIGIISQLIQNHNQDQGQIHNLTFLPTLLQQSYELQQINSIKSMLYGFDQSQRIKYDDADTILISDSLKISKLLESINKKRNILFLLNLLEDDGPEGKKFFRFGMLLKHQYDSEVDPDDNGAIQIYDPIDDQTSVYFNLNKTQALLMNLNPGCKLYSFNKTTGDLLIMETVQFRQKQNVYENSEVEFGIMNFKCFGENYNQARSRVKQLTGIQITSVGPIKNLTIQSVQVFYLTFESQNAK